VQYDKGVDKRFEKSCFSIDSVQFWEYNEADDRLLQDLRYVKSGCRVFIPKKTPECENGG
jgi:hypothetical protein